jgi:hypothetical protein
MGALYVASAIPAVESVVHIRALLDPDGFLGIGAMLPPWAVAPIAAGVAGFICASRTMAGRRWAGIAMGYVTYAIGLIVAPLAVFGPPSTGGDPSFGYQPGLLDLLGNLVFGLPAISMIASIALAPLLLVCAAAGMVWAFGLRAILVAGGATVGEPDHPTVDGWVLLAITAVLGLGWLVIGLPMLTLVGDPGFVD